MTGLHHGNEKKFTKNSTLMEHDPTYGVYEPVNLSTRRRKTGSLSDITQPPSKVTKIVNVETEGYRSHKVYKRLVRTWK